MPPTLSPKKSLRSTEEEVRYALRHAKVSRDQVEASLLKDDFYQFVVSMWSEIIPEKLVPNWHMRYVCRVLQRAAERVMRGEAKAYDLNIGIPPGTSKSTICSVMLVAWVWTRMPTAAFICCSYSEKLALRLSGLTRRVVKSEKYRRLFPHVEISKDMDTKGGFETTRGGGRYAVGSGTQVMGYHAHFIVIDDPIDPQAVLSETELDRINNWIKEQLGGRKKDKAVTVTVLVMQRLHQLDPAAVMAARKNVKNIRIPATTKGNVEPAALRKHYSKSGLMDPNRLPWAALEEVREGPRGDYVLSAQYLLDPVPPGGGMFKTDKIKNGRPPAKWKSRCRMWDKAGSQTKRSAWTAGVLLGLDLDGRVWVLDVVRDRWDTFTREKMIKWYATKDGKAVQVGVEQEPGSGGMESAEGTVKRLMGWRVRVLKARGRKEERADEISVQVNAGNVWCDKSQSWYKDFVEELRYFPFSTYKDQVDALAGAFSVICRQRVRVGGALPEKPPTNDPRDVLSRKRKITMRSLG